MKPSNTSTNNIVSFHDEIPYGNEPKEPGRFILECMEVVKDDLWLPYIYCVWPSLNFQDREEIYSNFRAKLIKRGLRPVLGRVTAKDINDHGSLDKVLTFRVRNQLRWATIKYGKRVGRETLVDSDEIVVDVSFMKALRRVVGEREVASVMNRSCSALSELERIFIRVVDRADYLIYEAEDSKNKEVRVWRIDLDLFYDEMTKEEIRAVTPLKHLGTPAEKSETKKAISRAKNTLKGKLKLYFKSAR
ncbi:MAG: hypothetical protein AAF065_13960 [Verrucomicrobiota bacterium]